MSNRAALEELVAVCRKGEALYRSHGDAVADPRLREAWHRMADVRAMLARRLTDSPALPAATPKQDGRAADGRLHGEVEDAEECLLRAFLVALEQGDSPALRGVLKSYLPQMSACRRALSAHDGPQRRT